MIKYTAQLKWPQREPDFIYCSDQINSLLLSEVHGEKPITHNLILGAEKMMGASVTEWKVRKSHMNTQN